MNLFVAIQKNLFVPSQLSLVLEGWREKMEKPGERLFAMAFRAQNQMEYPRRQRFQMGHSPGSMWISTATSTI
jgi:hypothetical protein